MHRAVKQFRERNRTECKNVPLKLSHFFASNLNVKEGERERGKIKAIEEMCGDFPSRSVTDVLFSFSSSCEFKGFDFNDDTIHVLLCAEAILYFILILKQ